MKKNDLIESIEKGLLDYYLSIDYSLESKSIVAEPEISYGVDEERYSKLSKRILFKAKLATRKARQAKVISIIEASGKLTELNNRLEGKVFPIFKRHVEEYGLAANYKNFDAMTEDEMKDILKQLDLTALFDEVLSEIEDE